MPAPNPLLPHAQATSGYLNGGFASVEADAVAAQTSATTANTAIAAATNAGSAAVAGVLLKWDGAGGIQPAAATLPQNSLKEFGVYASGPASIVVNWRGGTYTDHSGTNAVPRTLADFTTTHAAPGGGNERWDVVSMTVNSAGFNQRSGSVVAVGTSGTPPLPPVGLFPTVATDVVLGYVYARGAGTVIKDVNDGTNGFIVPAAMHNYGSTAAGGGGSSGYLVTDTLVGIGTIGDTGNGAVDLYPLLSKSLGNNNPINGHNPNDLRVDPSLIGTGNPLVYTNSTTLDQVMARYVGGIAERPQDWIGINGTAITIQAWKGFMPNGQEKQLPGPLTHTFSLSPLTLYYLYFDATPNTTPFSGGNGIALGATDGRCDFNASLTPPSLSTQRLIGYLQSNAAGTAFQKIDYAAFDSMLQVSSTQMVPIQASINLGVQSPPFASGASTPIPAQEITNARRTLHFGRNMRLEVEGSIRIAAVATGECWAYLTLDNNPIGNVPDFGKNQPSGWDFTQPLIGRVGDSESAANGLQPFVPAGDHILSIWIGFATISQSFTVQEVWWKSKQWGIFQ